MHTHQIMEQMQPLIGRPPYHILAFAGTESEGGQPEQAELTKDFHLFNFAPDCDENYSGTAAVRRRESAEKDTRMRS
jgi:hypothetical protein